MNESRLIEFRDDMAVRYTWRRVPVCPPLWHIVKNGRSCSEDEMFFIWKKDRNRLFSCNDYVPVFHAMRYW